MLTILLLGIAAYRGGAMLLSEPLLALANNYDMIRVEGCIKAYPLQGELPPWSGNPAAPIARYSFRYDIRPGCFFTTEVLFARLARPLFKAESVRSPDGSFSVRWLGLVKLLTFFALVLGFTLAWLRQRKPVAAMANALVVTVVLMDPAITLYLNGFYAEYAVIICGYASIAGAILLMGRTTPPGIVPLVFLALAVIALACTKIQHAGLGLMLAGLISLPWLLRMNVMPRIIVALTLGATIGLGLQLVNMSQINNQSMRLANLTSTVFTSFLPFSDNPHRTAENLGLPRRCGEYAGMSWYLPPISQNPANHPCPEVAEVSYAKLFGLALLEPRVFARFAGSSPMALRPWIPATYLGTPHLGVVAGKQKAPLPEGWFSWSRVLDGMPLWLIYVLVIGPSVIVATMLATRRFSSPELVSLMTTLALAPYPTILAVLFGNGYADAAKQMHLVFVFVLSFWTLSVALAIARVWTWVQGPSRGTMRPRAVPEHKA